MNILGHYYLSFEIIISVSFFCEIGFSFLPTASSVCDLIAGSHTLLSGVHICLGSKREPRFSREYKLMALEGNTFPA